MHMTLGHFVDWRRRHEVCRWSEPEAGQLDVKDPVSCPESPGAPGLEAGGDAASLSQAHGHGAA